MSMNQPIAESLKFTDFIMELVTGDLDDETARRRARDTAGASIAWIVGHLCHYRYLIAGLLGHQVDNPFAERFAGGASDGADYPSVRDLMAMWRETSAMVMPVVNGASDAQIGAPLTDADGVPHGEKTVLDTLTFFMWHESYHMGQLGTLRAQFGLKATATLATEASAA